jgi:ABC-type uncharacterized transport system fused permease/ATPase subunit
MSYDKMGVKLKALNDLLNEDNLAIDQSAEKITRIHIKALVNDKPALKLQKPILLNSGDHMLIDGVSGSGKTSLMYLLKGVIKVNYYEIEPPLEKIHSRCFRRNQIRIRRSSSKTDVSMWRAHKAESKSDCFA